MQSQLVGSPPVILRGAGTPLAARRGERTGGLGRRQKYEPRRTPGPRKTICVCGDGEEAKGYSCGNEQLQTCRPSRDMGLLQ